MREQTSQRLPGIDRHAQLVLPLIVALAAAYAGYGMRVLIGAMMIVLVRGAILPLVRRPPIVESLGLGVAVAIAWRYLGSSEIDPSVAWPLRFLGYAIVTPIVEEMAFRAFLIPWMEREGLSFFLAGTISALLFGVLHASLVVGILAGAAYVLAYRRGGLAGAVLAHATTNAALTLLG